MGGLRPCDQRGPHTCSQSSLSSPTGESSSSTPYETPSTGYPTPDPSTSSVRLPGIGTWSSYPTFSLQGPSSTLDGQVQSSTFLSSTDPSLSFTPSPSLPSPTAFSSTTPFITASPSDTSSPTTLSSSETSSNPPVARQSKQLNVTAIAGGVTGAVFFLIICTTIAFYWWKRKQKNKVPPSAEFMNLAGKWHPRLHHETASAASSIFTSKDGVPFASSSRVNQV